MKAIQSHKFYYRLWESLSLNLLAEFKDFTPKRKAAHRCPSWASTRSYACRHIRTQNLCLASGGLRGMPEDSGADPISCLGGIGFGSAVEHKGRWATATAVVILEGWDCIWAKRNPDLLLWQRKAEEQCDWLWYCPNEVGKSTGSQEAVKKSHVSFALF